MPKTKSTKRLCEQCDEVRLMQPHRKVCSRCRGFNQDVRSGTVRPPDFEEVNVANYKEPMQKVEGGHGYYGAITQTNDGLQIQCHICGYYFGRLSAHVQGRHQIKSRDYKIKYGLRITDGLLSPIERFRQQITYNKYARKSPEEIKAMSRKAREAVKKKGYKAGGDQWTSQTRNEKGLCKDQTIAKIRKVAEMNGGVATSPIYDEMFGGLDVVDHWFGSWLKGVEAAGVKTYFEGRVDARAEKREKIIEQFERFYEKENRTPQSADLTSGTFDLPTPKQVAYYFGTMNRARMAAGVPTLVFGGGGKWVEVAPEDSVITDNEPVIARGRS